MSRRDDVLNAAIDALEDGTDPFSDGFLIEHVVTLDECYALSDDLALGARMLVSVKREMASGGLEATVAADRFARALIR